MGNWPALDSAHDHGTLAVLHLASQMLGKIRVRHAPWTNQGWHVALRPDARGLHILPTAASDGRTFSLALDLCRHSITLGTSASEQDELPLDAGNIADLHSGLVAMLDKHGLPSDFHGTPNEIEGAIPFAEDKAPRRYDPGSAARLRQVLAAIHPVFELFRAGFVGKASPVLFWWGSFDCVVTRFSGRPAPPHPGGVPGLPDRITREAYSQEESSAGFWGCGVTQAEPFFYSYAYPEPAGYRERHADAGGWNDQWQEYTLSYDEVRSAADPEALLLGFLQSTYDAAADLAKWDRAALEREPVAP